MKREVRLMKKSGHIRSQHKKVLGILAVMLAGVSLALAQPQFAMPLRVSDGALTYTLYLGIVPTAHFCIDESDSTNGHAELFLPPSPPSSVFDARFVCPR